MVECPLWWEVAVACGSKYVVCEYVCDQDSAMCNSGLPEVEFVVVVGEFAEPVGGDGGKKASLYACVGV